MSKLYYLGFVVLVASTILFIVSILTPDWILKDDVTRGIFEVCSKIQYTANTIVSKSNICQYILLYSSNDIVNKYRSDYTIACSSLSIIASSLSIIFIWIAALYICVSSEFKKKLVTSSVIVGLILIDCLTAVIWIVMLAKNLDANNTIERSSIGWSLWAAVGSTGGYLISLVLFCMHRIDLGTFSSKSSSGDYGESSEYLQRF